MTIRKGRIEFVEALSAYHRTFVVYDERFALPTWEHWLPQHTAIIGSMGLVGGEETKSLQQATELWHAFAANKVDRKTLVLAIGGGSITDLAGFAASTYKRGLDVAFIPTTIIAMVDAAIGGKNGVNFEGIKNQIGTHHLPMAIGIDTNWLDSLPEQEQISGWMEMLKHSMLAGEEEVKQSFAVRDLGQIRSLITASAAIKSTIVEADPFESGPRKTLNLGHTVGHALEALSHAACQPMPHGIAIGFGLGFCLLASVECGAGLDAGAAQLGIEALQHWLKDSALLKTSPKAMWEVMQHDKKNADGQVLEVWLRNWGQPVYDQPLKFEDFQRLWLKTIATFAG